MFNVNANGGFVIVSAESATSPIIGYSNKGQYTLPVAGNNVDYWMQERKSKIINMRASNLAASAPIASLWNAYANNIRIQNPRVNRVLGIFPSPTQYLVQSTWDQPFPYNGMCPGGSVTGCVATAMSQIMRYWSYPLHGIGHSAYNDVNPAYSDNWGLLTADYDTSNYVWSAMPLSVPDTNWEVAKLLYDAGVSVDMDYTPTGSGAEVIAADDPICAQTSYVKYFGYDASTIQGLRQSSYNQTAWINLLEGELNNNRPVQYVGYDPNNGGHTWVCDGYNSISDFHMNWGWSGADNGWYNLDTLTPGPFNFSQNHEAVIGIEPPPVLALFTATPLMSCSAPANVTFTDRSLVPTLSNAITSWKWTFTGGTPSTSTIQNPSVSYNSAGVYAVTLKVTNNIGSDSVTVTNYITINAPTNPPLAQNFEAGGVPPAGWVVVNNPNLLATWALTTGVGGYGLSSHCMSFDNCANGMLGEYDQVYTPAYNFTSDTAPLIYFDVAYAPYDVTTNPAESDSLAVYYSLDCGATWLNVYLKGGMALCTAGMSVANGANANQNGCFVPLSNNWRTDSIKIPAIVGKGNVMFSFENRSGNGSILYVDNINIPTATHSSLGVNNLINDNSFAVYPNPSNGNFQVSFNTQQDKTYQLSVYNVLGQEVTHAVIQNNSGAYIYPVNISNMSKGVYTVMLYDGQTQTIKKIAIF